MALAEHFERPVAAAFAKVAVAAAPCAEPRSDWHSPEFAAELAAAATGCHCTDRLCVLRCWCLARSAQVSSLYSLLDMVALLSDRTCRLDSNPALFEQLKS